MKNLAEGDIVELVMYPVSKGYNPYVVHEVDTEGKVFLEEMVYPVEMGGDGVQQWHKVADVRQYKVTCPKCGEGISSL